jgi:hypothetical protein
MPIIILNKQQLNHLLDVYQNQGADAARALAPGYGIKPGYVKRLASKHSVKAKRQGAKRRKRLPAYADPRWQRAKAIGVVVA